MRTYNLEPRYSNQKSYYGKAVVQVHEDRRELYSYESKVCTIFNDPIEGTDKRVMIHDEVYQWDSSTSLKHIKEFLQQENEEVVAKGKFDKTYVMEYAYKAKKAQEGMKNETK